MIIELRRIRPSRSNTRAFYALHVLRTRTLPSASFRRHVAMAALAVRLTVPIIRVRRGLSPPSMCALPGAHRVGGSSGFSPLEPSSHTTGRAVRHPAVQVKAASAACCSSKLESPSVRNHWVVAQAFIWDAPAFHQGPRPLTADSQARSLSKPR